MGADVIVDLNSGAPRRPDVPGRLVTPRLVLRPPQPGDGPALCAAILDSWQALQQWMPWAREQPVPIDSEAFACDMAAKFEAREDLMFLGFARADLDEADQPGAAGDAGAVEGPLVLSTGLHRLDWQVRRFEIGYWRRTGWGGLGLVYEAVQALTRMAFEQLDARRVEIRMDDDNRRSWRVAERCGFTLEGVLRQEQLTPQGTPRDTRVYAQVRGQEWPVAAQPRR